MKPCTLLIALALSLALAACGGRPSGDAHDHGHDDAGADAHGHAEAEAARKGEHGGRWLEQDGHAVELAIAEDGTPPKYQAWLYRDGKPLPPGTGKVEVRLVRLGGVAENHMLSPQADGSLLAGTVVGEPHSFDVEVLANIDGKALRWTFES